MTDGFSQKANSQDKIVFDPQQRMLVFERHKKSYPKTTLAVEESDLIICAVKKAFLLSVISADSCKSLKQNTHNTSKPSEICFQVHKWK